jgi:hypothetical protein
MKRRNWKMWAAGIALVIVFATGVGQSLLWPMQSEAEQKAALIHEEMTWDQVLELLGPRWSRRDPPADEFGWKQCDKSFLKVAFGPSEERVRCVVSVSAEPPLRYHRIHLLTRLRRTLARAFPFLAE